MPLLTKKAIKSMYIIIAKIVKRIGSIIIRIERDDGLIPDSVSYNAYFLQLRRWRNREYGQRLVPFRS